MEKIKNKSAQTGNYLLKLFMLLVVVSASYSVYLIAVGTEGYIAKVMVAPLAIWVGLQLIEKFTK